MSQVKGTGGAIWKVIDCRFSVVVVVSLVLLFFLRRVRYEISFASSLR